MRITEHGAALSRAESAAARRRQIVAATIELLGERGYAGTSFDGIVKLAGLSSKRMITYHFDTKDQLYAAVVTEVAEVAAAFMSPLIGQEETFRQKLRTYVVSNIRFIAEFPAHVRAVREIAFHSTADRAVSGLTDPALARLVEGLVDGQRAGEFREFDPQVMAITVRAAIDAATEHLRAGADPADYAAELATLLDRATSAS
jgi:AcrR family transcriptional regulator